MYMQSYRHVDPRLSPILTLNLTHALTFWPRGHCLPRTSHISTDFRVHRLNPFLFTARTDTWTYRRNCKPYIYPRHEPRDVIVGVAYSNKLCTYQVRRYPSWVDTEAHSCTWVLGSRCSHVSWSFPSPAARYTVWTNMTLNCRTTSTSANTVTVSNSLQLISIGIGLCIH